MPANRPASEVAREIAGLCSHNRETKFWDWCETCRLASKIASALLAREAAAVEAERERCAGVCKAIADEMYADLGREGATALGGILSAKTIGAINCMNAIRGSK